MSTWTHRFALATALATFVLLLIGGIVHGTGSSLACPDWPTCFGSFFPEMKGNVLVEHGHRLVASAVGLFTIVLAVLLSFDKGRRRLFHLGLFAVGLVCFQGLLGGLTVIYRLPTLISAAHLATSMLFFSLLVAIACLTRPTGAAKGSASTPSAWPARQSVSPGAHTLLLLTTLLTYAQIALGGLVRHTGAGLACLDLPLCHGRVLPLSEHPTVLIQALHRLNALAVGGLAVVVAVLVLRTVRATDGRGAGARVLAWALPVLVLGQITLGVLSVLSFLGLFYVTAHLGVAALLLGSLVALSFLLRPDPALSGQSMVSGHGLSGAVTT